MPSSTTSASGSTTITSQELALQTARPETRLMFLNALMLVAGVIQGFRNGWDNNAFALIVGAIGAIVGTFMLGRAIMSGAPGKALGGIVPYVFGCYLMFVRGIWHGRTLLGDFDVLTFAGIIAFLYVGYRIVYWTWQLSEIGEKIRTGKVHVRSASPSAT